MNNGPMMQGKGLMNGTHKIPVHINISMWTFQNSGKMGNFLFTNLKKLSLNIAECPYPWIQPKKVMQSYWV
jgi:hypothetical protein